MKKTILFTIFCVVKTLTTAQAIVPLSLNTTKGFHDLTVKTEENGGYSLNITGANAHISLNDVAAKYEYNTQYYISFECKTATVINQMSIDFGDFSVEGSVTSTRFTASNDYKTVVFNLKESLKWTSGIKSFRLKFDKSEKQSVSIKNLQLRPPTTSELASEPYYLDNGIVRLGVDMTGGGSVFYFAEAKTRRNLLNHADKGRFVQQSYYGIKDSSFWGKKPWNWNPVQGGGSSESGSFPAKVLEKRLDKKTIYIKSMPKHWATGADITDAIMEEKITLEGKIAHITYTFRYKGTIEHPNRSQELPAVFVDYALPNLVFYQGKNPWKNDTLSSVVPGWPNQSQNMTEEWAAYVDAKKWGIGVYIPGTNHMTTYRHDGNFVSGERGGACSYFAPVRKFAIMPNMVFTYDVYLTIDEVKNIRNAFSKIKK